MTAFDITVIAFALILTIVSIALIALAVRDICRLDAIDDAPRTTLTVTPGDGARFAAGTTLEIDTGHGRPPERVIIDAIDGDHLTVRRPDQ